MDTLHVRRPCHTQFKTVLQTKSIKLNELRNHLRKLLTMHFPRPYPQYCFVTTTTLYHPHTHTHRHTLKMFAAGVVLIYLAVEEAMDHQQFHVLGG